MKVPLPPVLLKNTCSVCSALLCPPDVPQEHSMHLGDWAHKLNTCHAALLMVSSWRGKSALVMDGRTTDPGVRSCSRRPDPCSPPACHNGWMLAQGILRWALSKPCTYSSDCSPRRTRMPPPELPMYMAWVCGLSQRDWNPYFAPIQLHVIVLVTGKPKTSGWVPCRQAYARIPPWGRLHCIA